MFLPPRLRHFQGAVPPFRYTRLKQSFGGTRLTGSHSNTVGLPDPSSLAETTNLPPPKFYLRTAASRRPLGREAPPARGCPAGMSPLSPLPCPAPRSSGAPGRRRAAPLPPAGPRRPLSRPPRPAAGLFACSRARPPAATHRPREGPEAALGGGSMRRGSRLRGWGRLRLRLPPRPRSGAAPGGRGEASSSPRPAAGRGRRGNGDGPFPDAPFPHGPRPAYPARRRRSAARRIPPVPTAAPSGLFLPRCTAAAGEKPRSPRLPPPPAGERPRPPGGPFCGRGRDPAQPLPRRRRSPAAAARARHQAHPNAGGASAPVRLIPTGNRVPATPRC